MRELVVRVARTIGVEWPEGWAVGVDDSLVLRDGKVARVVEQPTTPGQVYGDLMHLLMAGAIEPINAEETVADLQQELAAAVPDPPRGQTRRRARPDLRLVP